MADASKPAVPAPAGGGGFIDFILGVPILLFNFVWGILTTVWYWVSFGILAILAMPAMWVMAHLYSKWEGWIKDNGDLPHHIDRLILIIPFTLLIVIAMMFYHLFRPPFEARVKAKFGLKPF